MTLKLAHLSDTHLGYEAYSAVTPKGNNQRGVDIVKAFISTVEAIDEWDPDIVIHSGDVAERPRVDFRYLLQAQQSLSRLADGGRRQVVVIAGNHDAPRSRKDVCFLELFQGIPGVHVVTVGYQRVDLGDVVVHAIPHDSLNETNFDEVRPLPGRVNILTSHGVAESSELFLRAIGREFAIPGEVMLREWDYVALGHWHKRGPVFLGGEKDGQSRIWYAGSTENISFRDLRDDSGMRRGWLAVEIDGPGEMPRVEERDVEIRRMFRLPDLDAQGMNPQQIRDALIDHLRARDDIRGAVVGQRIINLSRDVWALVDQATVRRVAREALHYEMWPKTTRSVDTETRALTGGEGEIEMLLGEIVNDHVDESLRKPVTEKAAQLLAEAAGEIGGETVETEVAA